MASISKVIVPTCSICLNDILPVHEFYDVHNGPIPRISHLFHQICIKPWLAQKEEQDDDDRPCPLCRQRIHEIDLVDTGSRAFLDMRDTVWSEKQITTDTINMALSCHLFDLLSHIARKRPDKEIADLAKEAAYTHQWNVLQFLVRHRLPAIANAPEYNRIKDCVEKNNQTCLVVGLLAHPLPCLEPCCQLYNSDLANNKDQSPSAPFQTITIEELKIKLQGASAKEVVEALPPEKIISLYQEAEQKGYQDVIAFLLSHRAQVLVD